MQSRGQPGNQPFFGPPSQSPGSGRRPTKTQSDRFAALLITAVVSVVVAVVTTGTFYWIRSLAIGNELAAKRQATEALKAGEYYPGKPADPAKNQAGYGLAANLQKIVQAKPVSNDPVRSWEGQAAWQYAQTQAGLYVAKYPQPQNVKVLKGLTTQQIWTYMQQNVSGALGVSCQYCHNLAPTDQGFANFGQEGGYDNYNKKVSARAMLILVNDLNKIWVANGVLPGWKGNYVNCTTCHNAQPKGMVAFPPQYFQQIPIHNNTDYKQVVKDEIIYNYQLSTPDKPIEGRPDVPVGQGKLSLTYKGGPTQEAVWLNQYSMYTMGWSLGVGCNYCHNSRNFVSYEVVQKVKAQHMLLMTTWINRNWEKYGAQPGTDGKLVLPGCYTCHQGNGVPLAAINQKYLNGLTPDQQQIAMPQVLRGLPQQ